MDNQTAPQAVATRLFDLIKRRGPLPVGYAAKVIGLPTATLRPYLTELQAHGVVRLYTENEEDMVQVKTA
jgi:DNA-binding IclR family transcriptional regulator